MSEYKGPHVEAFSTIEEAFAAMRRNEAIANAHTTPEQRVITGGDYFECPPEWNMGLQAYGYIMTRDEIEKSEKDCGAPEGELQYTMQREDDSFKRGYRFAWSYSVIEPDGELGHVHVSHMRKISKERFEAAKANGWR